MFRRTPSITSDPSFCATIDVPVTCCHSGALRLDYGNAILVGLPTHLVRRLQSVQNAAARLIYHMRSADHITDALVTLHWLRIPQRIEYKVAVMTYKLLHATAPRYLGPLALVSDLPGRRTLRSANTSRLLVPPFRLNCR